MNLLILGGAGNIGAPVARRLAAKGHHVAVGFGRDAAKLNTVARDANGTFATDLPAAARDAEVIVLAVPWAAAKAALDACGDVSGKVVWDCTNPLLPDMSGLALGTTNSGGEQVARWVPGARVVKGVPPFAELMAAPLPTAPLTPGNMPPPAVFVCGDDPDARATVMRLAADLGAGALEAGPLSVARCTEPVGLLLVKLGYVQGLGPMIGAPLLRYASGQEGAT